MSNWADNKAYEEKCKRLWMPWWDAGGWGVHDITQSDTAKFRLSLLSRRLILTLSKAQKLAIGSNATFKR